MIFGSQHNNHRKNFVTDQRLGNHGSTDVGETCSHWNENRTVSDWRWERPPSWTHGLPRECTPFSRFGGSLASHKHCSRQLPFKAQGVVLTQELTDCTIKTEFASTDAILNDSKMGVCFCSQSDYSCCTRKSLERGEKLSLPNFCCELVKKVEPPVRAKLRFLLLSRYISVAWILMAVPTQWSDYKGRWWETGLDFSCSLLWWQSAEQRALDCDRLEKRGRETYCDGTPGKMLMSVGSPESLGPVFSCFTFGLWGGTRGPAVGLPRALCRLVLSLPVWSAASL